MVNIKSIPQSETPLDYISDYVKNNENIDNKFCIVVPTERNLRIIANKGFKYSDVYKIENLFSIITKNENRILPKELRPFYLRRAIKKLNKDERLHIFKQENSSFLDNFSAFVKSSDTIFKFFRELFAEQITLSDLFKVSVYTDYEKEISTLYVLWEKYLDLIHYENFYDEWEQFTNISLLEDFITEYDHYVFLVTGFLNKYELEMIKKISNLKNVTVYFNYSGSKQKQHVEYEKYFLGNNQSESVLEDFAKPKYNNDKLEIYKCNSWISQYELITRKAIEFNKKHNIDLTEMAVIMPTDDMKTYFITLDKYEIYDVTMGNNVSGLKFYNVLLRASKLNEYLNFNNKNIALDTEENNLNRVIPIQDIIDLYSSSMILRRKDEAYIEEIIKYLINKNMILNKNNDNNNEDDTEIEIPENEKTFVEYITEEYYEKEKNYTEKELKNFNPKFDIEESKNKLNSKDYNADYISPVPQNLSKFREIKKEFARKKLYYNLKQVLILPLFNNEIKKILTADKEIEPAKAINIYIDSLKKLFDYFPDEKPEIDAALNLLVKLEKIYSFINEKISFTEASNIVLNEIASQTRKQEKRNLIEVSSLLESRNMRYKILFVPGMLESNFPNSNLKDMYINSEIRTNLGLPTYLDRENLTKNYLYRVMELSEKTIITYPITSDETRASGFIEELVLSDNIKIKKYEPNILNIFNPVKKDMIKFKENILEVNKNNEIIEEINKSVFSYNKIKTYLDCSLKFYLKYIKSIKKDDEPINKINEHILGNVLHSSLQEIDDSNKISKEKFLSLLNEKYIKNLKEYDAYNYSNQSKFIAEYISNKFFNIVTNEQDDNNVTIYREKEINVNFNGYKLTGRIDKIREYIEQDIKKYDIIDYKYKDNKSIDKQITLDDIENIKDIDIQLPFYILLLGLQLDENKNFLSITNKETKIEKAEYFSLKEFYKYNTICSNEDISNFKDFLKDILDEISSIEIPFRATNKNKNCSYCDYKQICERM